MSYALVQDVPASWEQYRVISRSFGQVPPGLLLHVAGPTDEGIRIIEIWDSELAWRQFSPVRDAALSLVDLGVGSRSIVRDLRAMHLVVGEALLSVAPRDWIAVGPGVVIEEEMR